MLNQSFQGLHSQNWAQAVAEQEAKGDSYTLITVLGTTGSTPRASGTKMVVTQNHIYDTIGGGHLEFKAIEKARQLLTPTTTPQGQIQPSNTQTIEHFQLAASLGQCCGGSAVIMFESFISQKMQLDIYGAGHVAHALITILAQLPITIRWIDSRAALFPNHLPANVKKVVDESPVAQVNQAAANSAYLILTHNHQLDFELTQAILKRNDAGWLGVIGSETKAKRFQHRLAHREFSQAQINTMICPVGLNQVTGKQPMEVAVSIAGQLIEFYQKNKAPSQHKQGLQWQVLKNEILQYQAFESETTQLTNLDSNSDSTSDSNSDTDTNTNSVIFSKEKVV